MNSLIARAWGLTCWPADGHRLRSQDDDGRGTDESPSERRVFGEQLAETPRCGHDEGRTKHTLFRMAEAAGPGDDGRTPMKLIVQPDAGITPDHHRHQTGEEDDRHHDLPSRSNGDHARARGRGGARRRRSRAHRPHQQRRREDACGNWSCGSSSRASASRGPPTISSATTAR